MENIYNKIVQTAMQYNLYSDLSDYLTTIYLQNRKKYPRFGYSLLDHIEKIIESGKYRFVNVTFFFACEVDDYGKIVGKSQMVSKIELLNDNERISGIKRWVETYYHRFHNELDKKDRKKMVSKDRSIASFEWLLDTSKLTAFYKRLIDEEIINSKEDNFYLLFNGSVLSSQVRIKWLLHKTDLFVFLRELKKARIIRYNEGKLNTIVSKTFSKKSGFAFDRKYIRTSKNQSIGKDISSCPILNNVVKEFSKKRLAV